VFPTIRRESPLLEIGNNQTQMAALGKLLASSSPTKVELRVDPGTEPELRPDLVALLSRFSERIEHLLIYGPGTSLPSAAAIGRLRQKLDASGLPNVPLVAATRGYFVELNRGIKFDAPVAGVAFPLTATVHGDDPETITENVTAPVDIAETARHVTGLSEIVISPLALYHPRMENGARFPRALIRPWLAATLVHAAIAGMRSVTLGANLLWALESSNDGLLSGLLECAGWEAGSVNVPLPAGVHALKLVSKRSEPVRLLVANLSSGVFSLMLGKNKTQIPRHGTAWIELPG
jgi:hypothetical protein